jgi:hypothetical protein
VYTFVGIRNKWLQIFFSAAYLASLAVAVLIIYVMEPPVSNGLQGAYVVAITLTGLILGGAALLLMEMTEGLGCLLGGFCFAMWLLVLQPGGLLTSTAPVVVFIVCFTLAGWATSFSRYTRPYGLICLTSFGGATVVVLGIDCFSKSGLKEFWAYIWNLNQNLFPLGATTYPLTKGMKVEIFVIIVLFLAGMASQSKLWNIIKKRRERRALDRLDDERNLRREEEKVGRRIERANSRQRVYWEAVYGNKDPAPSADSGVGSMGKEGHGSTVTSTEHLGERPIEMNEISFPPVMSGANLEQVKKGLDSAVLVRVVADDQPAPEQPESQISHDTNHLSPNASRNSVRNSQLSSNEVEAPYDDSNGVAGQAGSRRNSKNNSQRTSAGPAIVPLPFTISEGDKDDSSSVATFADDDNGNRFFRRSSQGSELLRSLSQRSQLKRDALSRPLSTSTEKLVGHNGAEDDRSSVAATVDDMTDDGDSRSLPELSEHISEEQKVDEDISEEVAQDGTVGHPEVFKTPATPNSVPNHQPQGLTIDAMALQSSAAVEILEKSPEDGEKSSSPPESEIAMPEPLPVALTRAALPPALPKVASSYRTNEWAKHLSNADIPEVEDIKTFQPPTEADSIPEEAPAVVLLKDLQQMPESVVTPPAPRSTSHLSSCPVPPQMSRTNSYKSLDSSKAEPTSVPWPQAVISRSPSHQSLQRVTTQQMQSMRSYRNSSTPNISQTLVESPIEDSPGPLPSSLIGQRETILRNKPSLGFKSLAATPESVSRASPDIRSSKIRDSRLDDDGDTAVLAQRSVVRQSTLPTLTPQLRQNPAFDSHQPRRQSSTPVNGPSRDVQLAQWRASVQQDLKANVQPRKSLDKSRSALLQEKMIAERQREMEQARKGMRENVLDERMRKGDMLEAHKEAMKRMQKEANKHV